MKEKAAAKRWWRRGQKARRRIYSAEDKVEALAKLDREIASLKANAAELPALRAECERLSREVWKTKTSLAEVAACIDAELCKKSPDTAIKHAAELVRAAWQVTTNHHHHEVQADLARIAARINPELCKSNPAQAITLAVDLVIALEKFYVSEEKAAKKAQATSWLAGIQLPYERGVLLLAGGKNLDRALPKFERFLAAAFTKDGVAQIRLQHFKSNGFTGNQWAKLYREYTPWWEKEKSNKAKKSALSKKRRGRVKRPKSDLRFTENRRHKQGYCRKCGKRVRRGERLCDNCTSGKPLLLISSKSAAAGAIDKEINLDSLSMKLGHQ